MKNSKQRRIREYEKVISELGYEVEKFSDVHWRIHLGFTNIELWPTTNKILIAGTQKSMRIYPSELEHVIKKLISKRQKELDDYLKEID